MCCLVLKERYIHRWHPADSSSLYELQFIFHVVTFPVCACLQLPHLPHISEGLMKRNLRRGDMRDMSLGQLQVITNDLHAQIQSK